MSNLNVHVEEVSPVLKRLRVDVPAERVAEVTERLYKRLGRTARLPGYRVGRIPRRILERHFGAQVRSDVARELVADTIEEALETTKLDPVDSPTVEPAELQPGEVFQYSARVEVRPEITLKQFKGFEVEAAKDEITDEMVEERLEELREQAKTLVPVEGREVAELGDVAVIDYSVEFEGESDKNEREGAHIQIEKGKFLEGNGERLVGAKIGEEREFEEALEGDEVPAQLKGKTGKVVVKLTGLKCFEKPELDDEFAKDVGEVDSLEEFRAKIRSEMEAAAQAEFDHVLRRGVLEKLVEMNPIEVPPALVERMMDDNMSRMEEYFKQQGFPLPEEARKNLRESGREQALFDIQSALLVGAVADAEGIEATEDEIEEEIKRRAESMQIPVETVRAFYGPGRRDREGLQMVVRSRKAEDLLVASAVVVEPKPEEKSEESEDGKKESAASAQSETASDSAEKVAGEEDSGGPSAEPTASENSEAEDDKGGAEQG